MIPQPVLKEDFLHYLWKHKLIPQKALSTTNGKPLKIINFGQHNAGSGPDFFNAKIELDGTIWAGNIEMHISSSDWIKHKHNHDNAYKNVILHVVYEFDKDIIFPGHILPIPTLELKGHIPKVLLTNYLQIIQSSNVIPCGFRLKDLQIPKIDLWMQQMVTERLYSKNKIIDEILKFTAYDWEKTLYILMSKYFGAKNNALPFEMLARSLDLGILIKNKNQDLVLQSLIFGQAGFLEHRIDDEFHDVLRKEYAYQKKKYGLVPIDGSMWKFGRLRPNNFPTIRLAQFVSVVKNFENTFSTIKNATNINDVYKIFDIEIDNYWDIHYVFGNISNHQKKTLGKDFIHVVILNAIAPLLYTYGNYIQDESYIDKSIFFLESMPAEKNKIILNWKSLGISSKNSMESQSLLQLFNQYCIPKKCLSCYIGHSLLYPDL